MQTAIILSISGNIFLFEDNSFTVDQRVALQELGKNICSRFPDIKNLRANEICKWFTTIVQDELKIALHEIKVSFVMRINNNKCI